MYRVVCILLFLNNCNILNILTSDTLLPITVDDFIFCIPQLIPANKLRVHVGSFLSRLYYFGTMNNAAMSIFLYTQFTYQSPKVIMC